jgi:hypothetical protein
MMKGTGFDRRNVALADVEEDIDVDGADEVLFGEAQFTESDIIVPLDEVHVDIAGSDDDLDNIRRLMTGSSSSAIKLPQTTTINRISEPTSYTCRICLDAYTDPTVSTGCWHTCCRECWLQCLGSTRLCPICKRITGVGELRRIYL